MQENITAGADMPASFLGILDEALAHDRGYFLDRGDSLLPTIAGLTAAEASQSLGPRSATMAAKVNHTAFYLDAVMTHLEHSPHLPVDWASSWAVTEVDEREWQVMVDHLRDAHARVVALIETAPVWDDRFVRALLGIVAHTAYHLGEIRQALAVVKPAG